MSTRADILASRIELGAQALAAFADGLSDAEWQTIVPNEGRSVGVLVHHVASVYPGEIEGARQIARGQPLIGVTEEAVDAGNAHHAQAHPNVDQKETIALLRRNSQNAADQVRQFTDEDLDRAATVSLYSDAILTAQFAIEDHALRHSVHHLAGIRAALHVKR